MAEQKPEQTTTAEQAPGTPPGAGAAPGAAGEGAAAPAEKKKKKLKKSVQSGIAHIQATFNNTMVTITDIGGNTISWSSAGARGFKGSRKSTPFAAQVAAREA